MLEGISLLDEMLPPEIDMDDDPESGDEEKNERLLQQKQEAAENRKKLQNCYSFKCIQCGKWFAKGGT